MHRLKSLPLLSSSSDRTAANPDPPIASFWDSINRGDSAGHYKSRVAAIKGSRGTKAGRCPRIMFTALVSTVVADQTDRSSFWQRCTMPLRALF
jgi:hypothetical protein